MAHKKLRFGIIGPGAVAHSHSLAIDLANGAELTAICGRDKAKTQAFARQHGIKAFVDSKTFLSSRDFDAVTIATPSGSHLEVGLLAARQGKHVLCEKPLEVTSLKSAELIAACLKNKVHLGVIFQARFDNCTRLAKEAIDAGRLGKILLASCQMRWYRSQEYYDSAAWRGTWNLDGGGSLMNQGIHTIDLLTHLVGEPLEVSAFQGPVTHRRIEVEDNLCAVVRFQNGAIGTIEASTSCHPGFPRRVEISGEKGTIGIEDNRIVRWEFTDMQPEDKEVVNQFIKDEKSLGGAADPMAIDVSGHRKIVEDFVLSVQENRQPCIDGTEGKKSVDFVCAVYESIRTARPVNVGK
jgi:UDP-N-acetyl-2-amino-2-deoxyglucuronate dehydrogenase